MCGHVGIAGKLEFKDEGTLKRLLIYDYFRGPDSTGLAALRNDGTVKVAKIASHPLDLFDAKRFGDALSGYNSTVFLGHNRLATKGVVNGNNAHPYTYDHITGAHNGTLETASWRALEEALGEKFDVDSQAIIAGLARLGVEETVAMLQGAWALVWIDTKDNTLNFLRNKERPFWYAYTKNFDRVFWASEWPFIEAATKLCPQGYELYADPEKGWRFWATKEDWWYRYDIDALKKGAEKRPKPRVKEVKGKEPAPVVTTYTTGTDPFHRRHQMMTTTSMTTSLGSTASGTSSNTGGHSSKKKETAKDNVIHLTGNTKEPLAGYIDKEEFDKIAKYGCSWCQADVEFEEPGVQIFQQQDMVLCPTCACDDNSRIYVGPEAMVG